MSNKNLHFSHELLGTNILQTVDDGIEAEKLGYDFVWVPDHLVDILPAKAIYDAWTTLAFIGAKTRRIRLGSGVTDTQRMHPAKTANIVSTLDNLTGGRAVLGIGAGEIMNTQPYGIAWEKKEARLKRLRETLEVIKLLWKSTYEQPVSYSGEFFSLENAHLSLRPVQKDPPIYVGSFSSKEMLRIAGELADGWYPGSQFTPEVLRQNVQIIQVAASGSGRSLEEIDIIASIPTFVFTNKAEIAEMKQKIKSALKIKLLLNQHLWKGFGLDRSSFTIPRELEYQFANPGKQYEKTLANAGASLVIPDEILEGIMEKIIAIGSPDECISTLEKYLAAGATHILFSSMLETRENYRLIAQEIIPRLRSK